MLYLLNELQEKLGYRFTDIGLLKRALTHPSYSAERQPPLQHNQRLEFLGDAVLQHVVTELLFYAHPTRQEGVLSKIRSALTKEHALVKLARALDLGTYLLLGRGEDRSGGRTRDSNLADAFEAVLGALYLDGGLDVVTSLLQRLYGDVIQAPDELLKTENPKGALQELAQERYGEAPVYEVLNVTGPEHRPQFEVHVLLGGEILGKATANSRKNAEKQAAMQALTHLM